MFHELVGRPFCQESNDRRDEEHNNRENGNAEVVVWGIRPSERLEAEDKQNENEPVDRSEALDGKFLQEQDRHCKQYNIMCKYLLVLLVLDILEYSSNSKWKY